MDERVSDLTSLGELWGDHRKRHGWPPEQLAPGVVLRRRNKTVRDPKTQEIRETKTYLVPALEDTRLFYAALAARNKRPEDAGNCPSCNGAGMVRYDRPIGSAAFARIVVCPRWSAQEKQCVDREPPYWAQ